MKLTRENFRGPWAGLPVAWDDALRLDEEKCRRDVARCCEAGAPGVYTGGTSGEFYAMEFDEFKAVVRATVAVCRERKVPSMVGCTSTYTLGAARRAAFAAECGADAIQVALPFWMAVEDDQVVPFFREVAGAAPGLALSVYETLRTKKALTVAQHRAIKAAVPDYLMVKANDGTVGVSEDGCRELSGFLNVFVREDLWARLGPLGAAGGCSSLVYWFPRYILKLWRSAEARDWAAVAAGCAEIGELDRFKRAAFANRGFTDSAIDRLGGTASGFLSAGLRCRGPYPHATPEDAAALRRWCQEHHPEMLEL
jgi:dihydrodipicolinate synthase/N-acetylneuraminate lyase